jgi:hypothetical protein
MELRCGKNGSSGCPVCLYDCDYVFGHPVVIPARQGGTLVQWNLDPAVRDEGDYLYTLQTGNAGVPDPLAWTDVVTEQDVCFLTDPVRRLSGVYSFTHYRLKLQTGERIYYSRPLHTMGDLPYADWREYQAVLRAESVLLSGRTGTEGILLKQKISGIPCRRCRDFNTGEVRDAGCEFCHGTGWLGGYYRAVHCVRFNIDPSGATIKPDIETQGRVIETRSTARAVASPILVCGDVWVNGNNSERYRIMQLQHLVEIKGVPVVYRLVMERLPFSDAVYSVSLD